MLTQLKLKGNDINNIKAEVFDGLSQLKDLELEENPFNCDCRLLSYKLWVDFKVRPMTSMAGMA